MNCTQQASFSNTSALRPFLAFGSSGHCTLLGNGRLAKVMPGRKKARDA